jgi:uncharacterized membrane protein
MSVPAIHFPDDVHTNFLMLLRWIHFLAGICWIGLLYFFNLVSIPWFRQLDGPTRSRIMPDLMSRALFWFRMSAALTVLAGLAYWGDIVASDARNGGATSGHAMASFFIIWTVTWALLYTLLIPGKGLLDNLTVLVVLSLIIVAGAAYLFLSLNNHGWESNRLLAIGIGGGIGWVMLLNVWGVVWRIQKRLILWTRRELEHGIPLPDRAPRIARQALLASRINAFLSIPLLFFMAAASHYPMFGS